MKLFKSMNRAIFNGIVTLFRARGGRLFVSHEPTMGWGKFANKVEIRMIPGSHLGLFQEPTIRLLAKELQIYLDETQSRRRNEHGQTS